MEFITKRWFKYGLIAGGIVFGINGIVNLFHTLVDSGNFMGASLYQMSVVITSFPLGILVAKILSNVDLNFTFQEGSFEAMMSWIAFIQYFALGALIGWQKDRQGSAKKGVKASFPYLPLVGYGILVMWFGSFIDALVGRWSYIKYGFTPVALNNAMELFGGLLVLLNLILAVVIVRHKIKNPAGSQYALGLLISFILSMFCVVFFGLV